MGRELVAIVRCKDCIKRNTPECLMWYECMTCEGQWTWETDYDYCSGGQCEEDKIE